jgi:hypothetical protein
MLFEQYALFVAEEESGSTRQMAPQNHFEVLHRDRMLSPTWGVLALGYE